MAKMKIPLQVLFIMQAHQKDLAKITGCQDVSTKNSPEKARNAAVVFLKQKRLVMSDDGKQGYMLTITNSKGVVGYGVTEEMIDQAWCEEQSKHMEGYTLSLTSKEETTSAAKKEILALAEA